MCAVVFTRGRGMKKLGGVHFGGGVGCILYADLEVSVKQLFRHA